MFGGFSGRLVRPQGYRALLRYYHSGKPLFRQVLRVCHLQGYRDMSRDVVLLGMPVDNESRKLLLKVSYLALN